MNALSPKGGDKLQKLARNDDLKKSNALIGQSLRKAEGLLAKAEGLRGQLERMRQQTETMREDIAVLKAQQQAEAERIEFRKQNGWNI
jgi:hypothetical protein